MKKIMRKLGFILVILLSACFSMAKEVSLSTAKEYADAVLTIKSKSSVKSSEIKVFQSDVAVYTYIVNYKPEGWAIVSADDRAPAIIAYSTTGVFDTVGIKNLPFYFWFDNYKKQIREVVGSKNTEKHPSWSLEYYTTSKIATVDPLIKVEWDQGAGWNASCPIDVKGPGGHAYAGCVAVAMAQCMSVYKHPTQGYGTHQYTNATYGSQFVNYGTTQYQWDLMQDRVANEHVALLLYHLGVSVDMGYGYDGSGAHSSRVPSAIKTYFDYASRAKLVSKSDYSDSDWQNLLTEELQNGRPIYYSGDGGDGQAGHAFNIDGVNEQGQFHLNWGWSGSYNGYFYVTSLTPGSSNFSYGQDAVINFAPRDHNPYDITLSNNSIKENLPVNSVVGTITTSDETLDDMHTYTVKSVPDINGNQTTIPFAVIEDKLVTTEILDYDKIFMYEIILKTTDKTGNSFEKSFLIDVLNNPPSSVITEKESLFKLFYENNAINFTFNNGFEGEFVVNVFDVLGKHIVSEKYNKNSDEFSDKVIMKNNFKGIYLVSFDFKNSGRVTKKLIVQ